MMDRATVAFSETQALRRENQGLKNRLSAVEGRLRKLEDIVVPPGEHFARSLLTEPDVEYPHHVAGTTGRGIRYKLSDGSEINAGKVKALAAEAALGQ